MSPPSRNFAPSNMTRAQIADLHLSWLQALPGDGPFLTIPVLTDAFPLGLDPTTPERAARFKASYNTLRAATGAPKDSARNDFIRIVATDILDWGTHHDETSESTQRFAYSNTAFGTTTRPAFVLWPCAAPDAEPDTVPNMLGFIWPHNTVLNRRLMDGWASTPIDRVAATLRHHNIPLGIVTSGRWWAIVWAPRGTATGHVLCDTHAMLDDRQLLDAFTSLLSRRRHLAVADNETLPALLGRALQSQEDLTENLSIQVRRAVEMLVDAVGHCDKAADGASLEGVAADHVYEGAVTVVMRLVFMLAAEERQLLPGDDDFYTSNYGIAGLADRLIEQANNVGEDVLARQGEAFPQVLATTRVVHDGVRHQTLNIKGYGGSVFDPNKYAWLEGRQPGGPGKPVHVDDRTMLHILKGLTRWQGRKLAYRTLDVEQIGYVYEGLLDHTAVKSDTPYLGLRGSKEPELTLDQIEAQAARGHTVLHKWLKDQTGMTVAQLKRALDAPTPDGDTKRRLTNACGGDPALADRIAPYLGLVRLDERTGDPLVFIPGDWFVTASSARSDAGSYYTPRSLAEEVVKHTLDGLVYDPGPLDTLTEDDWRIVTPQTIANLKIADIAMGSGAFLVAADRYLADRLIEAITAHPLDALDDPALAELARITRATETTDAHQVDSDADEATTYARRLIAARCLYGADINPTAVEMAKLSLWLATAAKDQPFGFLDHHLTAGDTLLGLTNVKQLEHVHSEPARGANLHSSTLYDQTAHIRAALQQAIGHRKAIESIRVSDLRDVEQQQSMLAAANTGLADLSLLADAITAETFAAAQDCNRSLDNRMTTLGTDGGRLLDNGTPEAVKDVIRQRFRHLADAMNDARPKGSFERLPTQWIVRFPEVFMHDVSAGFDAIIGNPPFLGGLRITEALGDDYNTMLASTFPPFSKRVDLCAFFFRRAAALINIHGRAGLIATNSISQGTTRRGGLDVLLAADWTIFRARSDFPWPTSVSVVVSLVYFCRDTVSTKVVLNGLQVTAIDSLLLPAQIASGDLPLGLAANKKRSFLGSVLWGAGFYLEPQSAHAMLNADPRNAEVVKRAIGGVDFNEALDLEGLERWVIDFGERDLAEVESYLMPFTHLRDSGLMTQRLAYDPKKYQRINPRWWRHFHARMDLYRYIRETGVSHLAGRARVSDVHIVDLVPVAGRVMLDTMSLFLTDDVREIGLLQSSFHEAWARRYASTLGSGMRYGAANCFANFPFPDDLSQLERSARSMLAVRSRVRTDLGVGNKGLYQLYNSQTCEKRSILEVREAMVELDAAVGASYGFSLSEADYGFFPLGSGVKFTVNAEVMGAMVRELLALNHVRYADEVARGLHGKQTSVLKKPSKTKSVKAVDSDALLFE